MCCSVSAATRRAACFDAFSDNQGQSTDATEAVDKRIDAQLARLKTDPKNADAFAQLAILRFQRAGVNGITQEGEYTEDGKRRLGLAADASESISRSIPSSPTCAPRTSWSRPTRVSTT